MKIELDMDRIKERQKLSWQGVFYGVQRIDLLIISISGAGIYVCLETLKYARDNSLDHSMLIKISGFILLLSIGFNFVSQIYGKKSNYYDYLWCEEKLNTNGSPTDAQKLKIDKYDNKSERFSTKTNYLTNISTVLMMSGLITIVVYFSLYF